MALVYVIDAAVGYSGDTGIPPSELVALVEPSPGRQLPASTAGADPQHPASRGEENYYATLEEPRMAAYFSTKIASGETGYSPKVVQAGGLPKPEDITGWLTV